MSVGETVLMPTDVPATQNGGTMVKILIMYGHNKIANILLG